MTHGFRSDHGGPVAALAGHAGRVPRGCSRGSRPTSSSWRAQPIPATKSACSARTTRSRLATSRPSCSVSRRRNRRVSLVDPGSGRRSRISKVGSFPSRGPAATGPTSPFGSMTTAANGSSTSARKGWPAFFGRTALDFLRLLAIGYQEISGDCLDGPDEPPDRAGRNGAYRAWLSERYGVSIPDKAADHPGPGFPTSWPKPRTTRSGVGCAGTGGPRTEVDRSPRSIALSLPAAADGAVSQSSPNPSRRSGIGRAAITRGAVPSGRPGAEARHRRGRARGRSFPAVSPDQAVRHRVAVGREGDQDLPPVGRVGAWR